MLTFLLWLSPVIVIAVLVWKWRRMHCPSATRFGIWCWAPELLG